MIKNKKKKGVYVYRSTPWCLTVALDEEKIFNAFGYRQVSSQSYIFVELEIKYENSITMCGGERLEAPPRDACPNGIE